MAPTDSVDIRDDDIRKKKMLDPVAGFKVVVNQVAGTQVGDQGREFRWWVIASAL